MIARDGDRCAVPYCDRPVLWSDAHHLQAWTTGGPTVIDNGALPCAAHHTMLHEGHWTLHRTDDGRYLITHPDGRTIGPEPHPPGHSRPPPQREVALSGRTIERQLRCRQARARVRLRHGS